MIKRLRATELAVTDDSTAKGAAPGSAGPRRQGPHKPPPDQMGPGVEAIPRANPGPRSTLGRPGMRGGFKPRGGESIKDATSGQCIPRSHAVVGSRQGAHGRRPTDYLLPSPSTAALDRDVKSSF
jgi:hypothetical protein